MSVLAKKKRDAEKFAQREKVTKGKTEYDAAKAVADQELRIETLVLTAHNVHSASPATARPARPTRTGFSLASWQGLQVQGGR